MTTPPYPTDAQIERKFTRRLRDYRRWKVTPHEIEDPEDAGRELEFAWGEAWELGWNAALAMLSAAPPATGGELVAHIEEQITFAETRIADGKELGATVWRLALEDIVRENRQALATLTGKQST